ncbi:MAG: adenine deaminase [Bacteroidetes bacterium]|nr:adenine deaminase [Bacteroidota bacterium]
MATSGVFKGQIVDVVAGRIFRGTLIVSDGRIESVKEDASVTGPYIMPGLIDAHIHIESSMLTPSAFARMAVVHGTVGTVSDPHEIANVLGLEGVRFMIRNGKQTPFKFNFGAPSCVPATGFETAGTSLGPDEIEELLQEKDIRYLSEMMNFPGVVFGDPEVHAKLELAKKYDKPVDGHAPGLTGEWLEKYAMAGISTDHECTTVEEALDKIKLGMHILIREGSAARNFDNLLPILGTHPEMVMFCSDDKHPDDLVTGHMNLLIKRAMAAGYPAMDAIRACTLNPVNHYKLDGGLLQVKDPADFITVDNLNDFNVLSTYIDGVEYAADGKSFLKLVESERPNHFTAGSILPEDITVHVLPGKLKVIEAFDGELVTGTLLVEPRIINGKVESNVENDILKIVVINRYKPSSPAIGFIHGFGLKRGALASTVAHDSHNLICVGTTDEEMCKAINLLVESKGGIAVSNGDKKQLLPLPIAGIMTDADGKDVAVSYESINRFSHELGSSLRAPFMTLSFMALLVIPELKLSDRGLFDGKLFSFTSLFQI